MSQAGAYEARLFRLQAAMGRLGLDAFLVTNPDNTRYLTGFTWGQHAYLLVTGREAVLVVRPTEHQQAVEEACACRVVPADLHDTEAVVARWVQAPVALGFEPAFLSVQAQGLLRKHLPGGVEFVAQPHLVTELRAVKEPWEHELIRRACAIYDRTLEEAIPELAPGMTENELAARLEYAARSLGADGFWFPSIVVAGARAALPHGRPSYYQAQAGDLLKIDMGPTFHGYPSDATRTLVFGPVTTEVRRVHALVRKAQLAALEACRPGEPCSRVHQAASTIIDDAGYGRYFNHPVGHGVWGPPLVGPGVERPLVPGMVITVEPGIYIPGWGGVRIEDSVLITGTGCEVLHSFEKDLVVL